MKKKILPALLALVMVIGLLPLSVFAAQGDTVQGVSLARPNAEKYPDYNANDYSGGPWTSVEFKAVEGSEAKNVAVTIKVTGLQDHNAKNSDENAGQTPADPQYLIGIAIPKLSTDNGDGGDSSKVYYQGWGEAKTDGTAIAPDGYYGGEQNVDSACFYFNLTQAHITNNDKGYVVAGTGNDAVTYTIDFTDSTLADDSQEPEQPETYTATFSVKDGEGQAIADAAITVSYTEDGQDKTVTAEEDGSYTLTKGVTYSYTVVKAGYENGTGTITEPTDGSVATVEVTLTASSSVDPSDPQCTCETKCTDDSTDDTCEVCKTDITKCTGTEGGSNPPVVDEDKTVIEVETPTVGADGAATVTTTPEQVSAAIEAAKAEQNAEDKVVTVKVPETQDLTSATTSITKANVTAMQGDSVSFALDVTGVGSVKLADEALTKIAAAAAQEDTTVNISVSKKENKAPSGSINVANVAATYQVTVAVTGAQSVTWGDNLAANSITLTFPLAGTDAVDVYLDGVKLDAAKVTRTEGLVTVDAPHLSEVTFVKQSSSTVDSNATITWASGNNIIRGTVTIASDKIKEHTEYLLQVTSGNVSVLFVVEATSNGSLAFPGQQNISVEVFAAKDGQNVTEIANATLDQVEKIVEGTPTT